MAFITIGDFDGVHFGHSAILKETVRQANIHNQKSICLTFLNNTKQFFGKETELITDFEYKKVLISEHGINEINVLDFNEKFASLSGEIFFDKMIKKYRMQGFVCGDNFKCGAKAAFDCDAIDEILKAKGIPFICIPVNGFSSSAIRDYIKLGYIDKANEMLGRDFSYSAPVVSGNNIGTKIGFPTLNQKHLSGIIIPAVGVYATYVISNGITLPAVTNIGSRPTVTDSNETVIETHILDFNELVFDSKSPLRVFFRKKLREEVKFDNIDDLKKQIKIDTETAKVLF